MGVSGFFCGVILCSVSRVRVAGDVEDFPLRAEPDEMMPAPDMWGGGVAEARDDDDCEQTDDASPYD